MSSSGANDPEARFALEWWLNVFFMINGIWVPGSELDGWAPRPYPSEEICLERQAIAEETCDEVYEAQLWICSPDEPLIEPPEEMRGVPC